MMHPLRPEFVAPAKGATATFGTNPIAFGIPKVCAAKLPSQSLTHLSSPNDPFLQTPHSIPMASCPASHIQHLTHNLPSFVPSCFPSRTPHSAHPIPRTPSRIASHTPPHPPSRVPSQASHAFHASLKANGEPVVFDMATSAVALFGVLTAKAKGEPLAEQVQL